MLCAAILVFSGSGAQCRAQEEINVSMPPPPKAPGTPLTDKIKYFDDGKLLSRSWFTPAGALVEKDSYYHDGPLKKVEIYGASGEKVEESNYDEEGRLDDNIDGWAAKRWAYKDGVLRVESTYGEDGHLTERKIFNAQGDMVDRQYVGDGKIDPTEEFNSGSVVRRETDQFYDKYGHETGSTSVEFDEPDYEWYPFF